MTLRLLLKDPLIRYPLAAAFILAILQIIVIAVRIKPQAEPIALHYTTYLGVDFLGAWYLVYLAPAASFAALAVNGILAALAAKKDLFWGYLLVAGSALISALLFGYTILLAVINS